MLLDGLSSLEDFDEYLVLAEQCFNESSTSYLTLYNNQENKGVEATENPASNWAKVIERISNEIGEILQLKRTSLIVLNRQSLSRFAENLVLICSHQLETSDTSSKIPFNSPIFWILLHRVIEFEELRSQDLIKREKIAKSQDDGNEESSKDEMGTEEGLPVSILYLIFSHDLLGRRSWCMLKGGVFALYLLEVNYELCFQFLNICIQLLCLYANH